MIIREIEFKSYESDIHSRVRLSALMKNFQQLAREDFDNFGCSYPAMREMGLVFVLTSMTLKIHKPLCLYKKYTLETVPRKTVGVRFFRDFYVYDGNEIVCEAVSVWALINFVTRRLARPTELPYEIPNKDDKAPNVEPVSKIFPKENYDACCSREVYYSMLDENNHLNNCNYADLIEDALPCEYHKDNMFISYLGINYVNEAKVNDSLSINYTKEAQNEFSFVATKTQTDNECFTAKIIYDFV